MSIWFTEELHPYYRKGLRIERVLADEQTRYKHLQFVETEFFGNAMILDGIIQLTERDNMGYHEMIVHVPMLAVGLVGLNDVFPSLKRGWRARIQFNIGQPFRPFRAGEHGKEHRRQLDEIGHEIMRHIVELIPPEKRGHYSNDPAIREAARGTEIYPWADKIEGEVRGIIH